MHLYNNDHIPNFLTLDRLFIYLLLYTIPQLICIIELLNKNRQLHTFPMLTMHNITIDIVYRFNFIGYLTLPYIHLVTAADLYDGDNNNNNNLVIIIIIINTFKPLLLYY